MTTSGERWKKWAERHPEKAQNRAKEWRQKKPKNILLCQARHRAKKQGLDFDITVEDFDIPEVCPYLGIPISHNYGQRISHDNSPSLDRIDNSKGYVKGNVEIISYRANSLKAHGTAKEHEMIAAKIKELFDGIAK